MEGMDLFMAWIVVIASRIYTYLQTHQVLADVSHVSIKWFKKTENKSLQLRNTQR